MKASNFDELLPINGIKLGTAFAGILDVNHRPDVVVIEIGNASNTAALFTSSSFKAPPVIVSKNKISRKKPKYIVINTGIANSGTGDKGISDACHICDSIAELMGVDSDSVLACSTGRVGEYLPVPKILAAIPEALSSLSVDGWEKAASGILTIDSGPKGVSKKISFDHEVTITGIVKGSGMIKPNMATMLSFVATDACIDEELLNYTLKKVVNETFNQITIDRDMSTNDSVFLIATGSSGSVIDEGNFHVFYESLLFIFEELALAVVKDPIEAEHIIEVSVVNALSDEEAKKLANEVAESLSVKTAISNKKPYWGYMLVALGHLEITDFDTKLVNIWINGGHVVKDGAANQPFSNISDNVFDEFLKIRIDVARGRSVRKVLSNDVLHHAHRQST